MRQTDRYIESDCFVCCRDEATALKVPRVAGWHTKLTLSVTSVRFLNPTSSTYGPPLRRCLALAAFVCTGVQCIDHQQHIHQREFPAPDSNEFQPKFAWLGPPSLQFDTLERPCRSKQQETGLQRHHRLRVRYPLN